MGFREYALSFVIGVGVVGIGTAQLAKYAFSPKQAIIQKADLNQDGIPDLVMEKVNGTKVPMYGVKEGDEIIYVSASEMMKRNPDSIINYETIESKLNE